MLIYALAQGRRVLLAEDNLINQTVAKKMLTVLGLVCEVACNGQEAVDLARCGASDGRPFDVVLMDMAMPVMNGTEACRVRREVLISGDLGSHGHARHERHRGLPVRRLSCARRTGVHGDVCRY